jgi:glutamine amidotransferase
MGRSWFANTISPHTLVDFLPQFMHNGGIEQFPKIKRRLQQQLSDEVFHVVNGNTDSEWSFALFLSKVCRSGPFVSERDADGNHKLRNPNALSFTHTELQKAMLETIASINQFSEEAGITEVCWPVLARFLFQIMRSFHSPA